MAESISDGPVLLVKKLGGMFSIVLGCLLTAVGITFAYSGMTVIGVLLLALGAVLLALKIIRRNQQSPPG